MENFTHSSRELKKALRAEMRRKRSENKNDDEERFKKLVGVFLQNIQLEKDAVVASYSALQDEMDPTPLDDALRKQGHKIVLPVIIGKKKPLIFRVYNPGDMLLANPWGIFEPASAAENLDPDVILIPLLAFDPQHNRLGYGGGYYDRTIKKLRRTKPVRAIGLASAYQEIPEIPTGPNDVPLDQIVTENGVL